MHDLVAVACAVVHYLHPLRNTDGGKNVGTIARAKVPPVDRVGVLLLYIYENILQNTHFLCTHETFKTVTAQTGTVLSPFQQQRLLFILLNGTGLNFLFKVANMHINLPNHGDTAIVTTSYDHLHCFVPSIKARAVPRGTVTSSCSREKESVWTCVL